MDPDTPPGRGRGRAPVPLRVEVAGTLLLVAAALALGAPLALVMVSGDEVVFAALVLAPFLLPTLLAAPYAVRLGLRLRRGAEPGEAGFGPALAMLPFPLLLVVTGYELALRVAGIATVVLVVAAFLMWSRDR